MTRRLDDSPEVCRVHKQIARSGEVRSSAVISTPVVREICQRHITSPVASVFMGRAITGAVLLACTHKEDHRIGVEFSGNGPLQRVMAEASFEGAVRAYCQNPNATLPPEHNLLDMKAAIGSGTLSIDLVFKQQQKPYRGTVPIQTGEVGDDIAYYLHQSQQIPSIVSLSVLLDPNGQVMCAGGVLIELMPGYSEATVVELEERAIYAPSLTQLISEGASTDDLLSLYMKNLDPLNIEHPYEVRHRCRCSRQRILNSMGLFSSEEIQSMVVDPKPCLVTCEFCKENYTITSEELGSLLPRQ
jgi:molecular chaperone Hsp33